MTMRELRVYYVKEACLHEVNQKPTVILNG